MSVRKSVQDACKSFGEFGEEKPNDEEKATIRKAMKSYLKKYDENWDEDPDERAAVMAKLREAGTVKSKSASGALVELKKSADDAVSELARVKDVVKKSVGHLDAATPAIKPALDELAAIIGHMPVHQIIAALPESARAQIEMLQKSAADTTKQLADLQKSQADAAKDLRRREMVAKAAALPHVPLGTDELGGLMHIVTDADAKAGESLAKLLAAVETNMAKSATLQERGTSALGKSGGVMERVQAMAKDTVAKSAGTPQAKSMAQAVTAIFDADPALYHQWEAEHREAVRQGG